MRRLYLYGTGEHTEALVHFLQQRGVEVAGVVRPEGARELRRRTRRAVPQLEEDALAGLAAASPATPIVMSPADPASRGPILSRLRRRRRYLPLETLRRLDDRLPAAHPVRDAAALVPLCRRADLPGSFALLGHPGSGNRVVQAILRHIYFEHVRPRQRVPRVHELMRATVRMHADMVVDYFTDAMRPYADGDLRVRITRGASHELSNVRIVLGDGRYVFVHGLAGRDYFGRYFTGHLRPGERLLAFLEANAYRPFYVVRHPLDVVVSAAAKIVRPPEVQLDDDDWLAGQLEAIARTLREARAQRHRMHVVRYEDLIAEPVATIHAMARALGVELSDRAARGLWETFGFREVTPAGGTHLWRPGSGKYREYVRKEAWPLLEASGLLEAARAFGYEVSREELRDRPARGSADALACGEEVGGTDKFFGKIDARAAVVETLPAAGMRLTASDTGLAEAVKHIAARADFARLINCAAFPDG